MTFQPGQSGNPAGRPKGSINKQLAMLRAATEAVLPLVLARALGGDFEAQKLILERGLPKFKPIELPIEFELPAQDETSQARAVLQQVADGLLPVSSAKDIINGLTAVAQKEKELEAQTKRQTPPMAGCNAYLHSLYAHMAGENH